MLVAAAVVAGVLAAVELELLVLLLELPHPASASATRGAARINRLFTLVSGGCSRAGASEARGVLSAGFDERS